MKIIFDLDGTLADCEHRRHLVTKDRRDPQWGEFFRRCVYDAPIKPIIKAFSALLSCNKHHIEIWSGRSEAVRPQTIDWLMKHVDGGAERLTKMRPLANYEPDDVLKWNWLMRTPHSQWPQLVFDDRKKVVDMWRRHGIMCAQVAPGEF